MKRLPACGCLSSPHCAPDQLASRSIGFLELHWASGERRLTAGWRTREIKQGQIAAGVDGGESRGIHVDAISRTRYLATHSTLNNTIPGQQYSSDIIEA